MDELKVARLLALNVRFAAKKQWFGGNSSLFAHLAGGIKYAQRPGDGLYLTAANSFDFLSACFLEANSRSALAQPLAASP